MDVEALTQVGRQLLISKWFSVSMYALWIYDYFLTLENEVEYAWSGRKGWIFLLFIANRYLPMLHIVYKGLILFGYTKTLSTYCMGSQLFYRLRCPSSADYDCNKVGLYAVTGRNKLCAAVLSALILAQIASGLGLTIVAGIRPLTALPPINLDAFRVCAFHQWRPGEFSFVITAVTFDCFAFLVVYIAARGPGVRGYPGIPNLLRAILRDATVYFFLMFACQIVLLLFLFLAPASIQLLPGITHAIFLPMMACRLMLSLRRAASESTGLWSLSNRSRPSRAISTDVSLEFRSPTIDVPLPQADEEAVELESVPELPRDGGAS